MSHMRNSEKKLKEAPLNLVLNLGHNRTRTASSLAEFASTPLRNNSPLVLPDPLSSRNPGTTIIGKNWTGWTKDERMRVNYPLTSRNTERHINKTISPAPRKLSRYTACNNIILTI